MAITRLSNNFNGTSSGAPTLHGQAGSLVSVLDFCLVTTLGWTKDYSATNKATYRAGSGNRFYLYVDDTSGQNARWRGYETMSAITPTGTGPFPTDAQVNGGLYAYKSSAGDTTSRPWLFLSNGTLFYLLWKFSGVSTTGQGMVFGDIASYKTGDGYHTIAIGDAAASGTTSNIRVGSVVVSLSATTGHYMARTHTGTGTAITVGKGSNPFLANGATEIGAGGATYPLGVDSSLLVSPMFVIESSSIGLRGRLPGMWSPNHSRPLGDGDTYSGVSGSALDGKSFEVFNVGSGGQIHLETTDTW